MATYFVDPVSGNNSNNGALATPWLTLSRAYATSAFSPLLTNGDTIILRNGNHTISATLTTTINHNLVAYPAETPVILGAFDFTLNGTGNFYVNGITFGAGNGLNSKLLFGTGKHTIESCIFTETTQSSTKQALRGNNYNVVVKNCVFNIDTNTSGSVQLFNNTSTGNSFACFYNNTIKGYNYLYNSTGGQVQMICQNNIFNGMSNVINTISSTSLIWLEFSFNTFYNCTNLINYSSASNLAFDKIKIYRNFLGLSKIINNASTGSLTLTSLYNDENIGLSTTNVTGLTQSNYSTVASYAACLFYNLTSGSEDFRVEITSPLISSSTYVGAKSPEWDAFWSDVPANKVESGYSYRVRSRTNNTTGTMSGSGYPLLATSDVKIGVDRGDGANGTYDGSDRWSDPLESNVRNGTSYKANSLTNNKTGTYDPITGQWEAVSANDLRSGVSKKQNGTTVNGLLNLPSESNVRNGTSYDNATKTGTAHIPSASNVRSGTNVDNTVGTLDLPATTDVKSGVSYDGATKTGSYDPITGSWEAVSSTDLRAGITKKQNGSNVIGQLDLPSISNVKLGINYDNNTKTGTLESTDPGEANVIAGTAYKINSVSKTGSYVILNTDSILASELKIGVTKTINNVSVTGTYDASERYTDLSLFNVRYGTSFRYNSLTNNRTGTLDLPLESDVREGTLFDNDSKEGTLHIPYSDSVSAGELKIGVAKTINDTPVTGTYDGSDRFTVPTESQVESGVAFKDNNVNKTGTLEKLDLTKFTDVPVDKVQNGYDYKYNSSTANRTGTANIGASSVDPGEWNVLKDVPYAIDGVNKVGLYDNGELVQPTGENIRILILKEIENTLYRVNPATSSIYQNCIKSVSLESGLKQGIVQDDMPHVQIIADENEYDHKFVLSGNRPMVKMKVKFMITSPSNWNIMDNESLYEDIRQAFIRDNFTLNGLVLSVKALSVRPINSDADKADDNRRCEMTFELNFIEQITNLN